jgi:hypothetical protein
MTKIAYCHAPRFIHGVVRDLAPEAVNDEMRDEWYIKVGGSIGLTVEQLDIITRRLVERLNREGKE